VPRRRRARTSAEQLDFLTDTGEVLAPFAAPFARDVGAVVADLDDLGVARAVVDVCCAPDAARGLSLGEIAARVDGRVDPTVLDRRLRVFVGLGMLRPLGDRRGTDRYVLDPRALAGLQVAERVTTQGGVSELLLLLDRTAAAVAAGNAVRGEVAAALERALLFFRLFADTLARLLRAPIAELYAEVRHHENQRLLDNLDRLTRLVASAFTDLEPLTHATLVEAQRYDRYLGAAADRVIAEGGAARDFSMLSPETWHTAATHASWDALAEVATTLVFDAPAPAVAADALIAAVEGWQPRVGPQEPPPEPEVPPGPDPLTLRRQERQQRRERLDAQIGSLLQGAETNDVTSVLRGQPWRAAAALLTDVLAADRDPHVPVTVALGDGLLGDPRLEVAWCTTPVTVARPLPDPTTALVEAGADALGEDGAQL
jgi:hypothetical protein